MKLKLSKNGIISNSKLIITPAGNFTGEEFYEFAEGKGESFETDLSKTGFEKINNLEEDMPTQFHICYQGFGWIPVNL